MAAAHCFRLLLVALLGAAVLSCATPRTGAMSLDDPAARIRRVETGLPVGGPALGLTPTRTIEQRLRFHRVPGVSVAVIHDGRLDWARGWGDVEAGRGVAVDAGTLFQAGSVSKPVAALGALMLMHEGLLDLDEDVNARLRTWKVPSNDLTAKEKVTLRRLLSHSAGTDVHGFPGYHRLAPLPSLVQILEGRPPANTPAIRVTNVPGAAWRYSGGGYSIAQSLMVDATGQPFHDLMRERVLDPLAMRDSTFEQPLSASPAARAASGHDEDGAPVPGGFLAYPEQAAAGLWTTPSDLARFAIEVQRALAGDSGIIPSDLARLMVTRQAGFYGLGFFIAGGGDDHWFEHGGSNRGFEAHLTASTRGQGVVIMTNGQNGAELAQEIRHAVARAYGWPR